MEEEINWSAHTGGFISETDVFLFIFARLLDIILVPLCILIFCGNLKCLAFSGKGRILCLNRYMKVRGRALEISVTPVNYVSNMGQ